MKIPQLVLAKLTQSAEHKDGMQEFPSYILTTSNFLGRFSLLCPCEIFPPTLVTTTRRQY